MGRGIIPTGIPGGERGGELYLLGSKVVRGEGNYTYGDPRSGGERGIIPMGIPGGERGGELYLLGSQVVRGEGNYT